MSFPVTLGGLVFDVPSLPWRLVKKLQPELLGWVAAHDISASGALRLTEADLDGLADLVFEAVQRSPNGAALSRDAFDELPASTLEMAQAVAPVLRACGLKFEPRAEADPKA